MLNRIKKETQKLLSEPTEGIYVKLDENNFRLFHVIIQGPSQSPYEGGSFMVDVFLPNNYPIEPPKVHFMTQIYHPNIDKLGRICLDILKDKWSPALQINKVLLCVQALLASPNPDDPLDNDVANHWKQNEQDAIKTAQKYTAEYAKPNQINTD